MQAKLRRSGRARVQAVDCGNAIVRDYPEKACGDQRQMKNGQPVRLAGMVITRQRPGTAKGVIFVTLEDETGIANLVVFKDSFERYRRIVLTAGLLGVEGRIQREGQVIHVTVSRLTDLTERLRALDDTYMPGAAPRRSVRFKARDFQ